MHLVLDCVISKVDGESTECLRWTTRSTSDIITKNIDLDRAVEKSRLNIQRNLDILHSMPSGKHFYNILVRAKCVRCPSGVVDGLRGKR
jgi:hypothetical protein